MSVVTRGPHGGVAVAQCDGLDGVRGQMAAGEVVAGAGVGGACTGGSVLSHARRRPLAVLNAFGPRMTPNTVSRSRHPADQPSVDALHAGPLALRVGLVCNGEVERLPAGTVTMLFSDIEGSTMLLSKLGDRYVDALAAHRAILRSAWARWDGREVGTEGDSFFVVFDRAAHAIGAAQQGQRDLAAHAWPGDAGVKVRMGVRTGEPTIHDDSYVGMDVHRAARIAGVAHGGQVVVSSTTKELVADQLPDDASWVDLGRHRLKNLGEAEHLFQLTWSGLDATFPSLRSLGSETRLPLFASELIGRDEQLRELRLRPSSSEHRLLTLTGPGGTGKTRLAVALAAGSVDSLPMAHISCLWPTSRAPR